MGKPLTIADGNAFFTLPKIGSTVEYLDGGGTKGWVSRKNFDTIAIQTKLGQTTKRSGYESQLKFTLTNFIRAHAVGPIVGHESPHGIYFTPKYVNYQIQQYGIEKFVRAIGKNILPGQSLYITATVVRETFPHTVGQDKMKVDFLKSITYTVHTQFGQTNTRVFEAGFEVAKPNDTGKFVLNYSMKFSAPYISPDIRKYCNFDNVLKATQGSAVNKAVSSSAGKNVPVTKRSGSQAPVLTKSRTSATQNQPNATTRDRATTSKNRLTGVGSRATGNLLSKAKGIAAHLAKFHSSAGRNLIKHLPRGLSIRANILSVFTILNAINITTKVFAHGTPLPELSDKLHSVTDPLNKLHREIDQIRKQSILNENHRAVEAELYNVGDMETLGEITDLLLTDYQSLAQIRTDLTESIPQLVDAQTELRNKALRFAMLAAAPTYETYSKGIGILMSEALQNYSVGLGNDVANVQKSVATLHGLLKEYSALMELYNDAAWTISILRNHDRQGVELPKSIIKPTTSLWGPDVLQ